MTDNRIEKLEAALREINNRLNDDDSWLAQSIDCRNIAEAALGGRKMIEDTKVEQTYGWVTSFNNDGSSDRVWSMTKYRVLFKRSGEWHEVPVENINPEPPKDE